jgi:hypothetical protein
LEGLVGLGPNHKYFSEDSQDLTNYELFPIVKPMDQGHGTVDRWRGRVHGGPSGGAGTRHGGVLPACGVPCAAGPGSSPVGAGDEEGDKAELVRGSP